MDRRFWLKGGWFIDGWHAMQARGIFAFLRRCVVFLLFLSCIGLLFWLAWYIPHSEIWRDNIAPFLQDNPTFVVVLIVVLVLLLFWLFLWKLPQRQVAAVSEVKDRIDLETKSRQTMAQILGGAALLGGLFFTAQTLRINQQTLETTQEGQITERFTKAIDQLGKSGQDNLAVRLGGIYALERIARASAKDHGPIMEVLTAFVREQTFVQKTTPNESLPAARESSVQERVKIPTDSQAILTVLGRRTRTYGKGETRPLDLSGAHLQGAFLLGAQLQMVDLRDAQLQEADLRDAQLQRSVLIGAQLQGAFLTGAQLQGAFLNGAQLQRAILFGTQLQGAELIRTQFQGANLIRAQLQRADLRGAQFQGAFLTEAQLQGADLRGAQFQGSVLWGARDLTQDRINTACVDEHTILPPALTRPVPCPTKP